MISNKNRPRNLIQYSYKFAVIPFGTCDERYIELMNQEGGKPENMCEVLDRAEARGMIKGREEGRLEGRQEGIDESRLDSIRNIMDGLKLTAQQAMDILKIPVSERGKYIDKL